MTIVEALKGLLARVKASGWGDETNREAYEALTPEEKREYRRLERSDYFVPENAQLDRRQEHVSPSGKYKLVVTPYSTKAGSWNYTQGLVYAIGSDTPIAEVQRNYSNFFFEFVEDHPNDHAYLVCGEDYQGQTVIELDTGRRRDFLPKEADDGVGFCWAQYTFDKATQILVVDGCYWACPYEYRFFDFSDPMAGWPEIESEVMIDVDAKPPTIEPDGTIKAYLTHNDEDSDEEVPVEKRELASTMTFRREGLKLVKIDEWISEPEKERRAKRAEAERKYNEWKADFRANDPLYLAFVEGQKDPVFSPESHEWAGVTHKDWCPHFHAEERRWGKDLVSEKGKPRVHLEWGVFTGPIKVYSAADTTRWFPHSVEGMQQAFEYAKELARG